MQEIIFKKETYSHKAADYIRGLIRSGELLPGQPIREALISQKLNISRAPIREALLLLGQQGLVCSKPQKGKFVRSMNGKELRDSYHVAGILEGAGVAQAVTQWTEKEDEAFRAVVSRLEALADSAADPDTLAEIDEEFHLTLLAACTNDRLIDLARTSCASLAKFLYYKYWRTLFTPKEFYHRHHLVAEAVFSKDPVRIETAIRQHYDEVGIRLSRLVEENQN